MLVSSAYTVHSSIGSLMFKSSERRAPFDDCGPRTCLPALSDILKTVVVSLSE